MHLKIKSIYQLANSICLTLILTFSLNQNLVSQSHQTQIHLTLDKALSRALKKNNQIRINDFALQKAKWDKKHAWSLLLPGVSLNSRFMRIDDRTFAERDFRRYLPPQVANQMPQTVFQESYFTSLDVTVPLFNGALVNGLWIANTNVQMANQMGESTRNNIIFLVISTYLNVLKGKDVLNLQQEYLNLSQLNFEKAERLQNAGRYSKAEALRWKVDFEQQKSLVVSSESTVRSTLIALKRLLNLDLQSKIEVDNQIPQYLTSKSANLAELSDTELIEMIQLNDDDLIRANAALAAAKSNEKISNFLFRNSFSNYLPNVSLSYNHAWRENNTLALDDYSPKTVMINFSLPLFNSFQDVTASKSAHYSYRQSQEQFEDQLLNLRFVLTETVNKIINLKTQQQLAGTNVEYSEHNYRIISQQKDKGLVSNIDFIDAKLNLQNAKLNQINTHYDFIAAIVELYYLLGKIEAVVKL